MYMAHEKEFAFHVPSEKGKETMNKFRQRFSDLLRDIRADVPSCPELTLVQRKLEEGNMYLNKAINLTDPDSEMIGL